MPEYTTSPSSDSRAADPGSAIELAQQIRRGETTPSDLLERYLTRLAESEPAVEAWRYVDREGARAEAARLSEEAKAGRFRGPLHGLPVGIKDIIDVAGLTTLAYSHSRKDAALATADAEVVAALRVAGALVLGKTHTTEYAFFDPSPARNPHNTRHTPGGSSSGSGAALASGTVPLALGTQTVASVNRPAAYCGIAAYKPSSQLTCLYGVLPLAPVFDTIGCYGRDIADAVALFQAMCPALAGDDAAPLAAGPLEFVRLQDPVLEECDTEIAASVESVAGKLETAGHRIRAAESPEPFGPLFEVQLRVMYYEAARIYAHYRDAPQGTVGPKFHEMLIEGLAIEDATYRADRARLAEARRRFWSEFADTAGILFPATPTTAPPGLASTGDPKYIAPWTALGGPIVTMPAGFHSNGLPVGVLLCGAPGSDRDFCQIAAALK